MDERTPGPAEEPPINRRGSSRRQLLVRGGAAGAGALGLPAFLAACGDDEKEETTAAEAAQSNGEGGKFYAVTQAVPGDPFWAVYRKGLEDAANDFGVEVVDQAPEEFSIEKQVNLLESAIATKPDGLMVMITDPDPLDRQLRGAIESGIPVVAVNVPDPRGVDERIPYLFYVGGDEELSGRACAERQLEERTPKRAAAATHSPGQIGNELRIKGYRDVMKDAGVTADKIAASPNPTESAEILRNYFRSNEDTDAFFSIGPPMATPALQVIDELGLTDKVMHSTFDLSEEQADAIVDGRILSTIGQQQYLQGYLPPLMLKLNKAHLFDLATDISTGPFVIDKSNIDRVLEQVKQQYW